MTVSLDSRRFQRSKLSQYQTLSPLLLSSPIFGQPKMAQDLLVDQSGLRSFVVLWLNFVLHPPMHSRGLLLDTDVSNDSCRCTKCPWTMQLDHGGQGCSPLDFQSHIRFCVALLADLRAGEAPDITEKENCLDLPILLRTTVSCSSGYESSGYPQSQSSLRRQVIPRACLSELARIVIIEVLTDDSKDPTCR